MLRSFELPEAPRLRTDGDVNIIEGWIVPFNQVANVIDVTPTGVQRYKEGFLVGSLTRMEQGVARRGNASFMRLTLDHEDGLSSRVGCGMTLEQRGSEGAWAGFKLYRSANLDLVKSMIEESHDGFSIEFDDVVPPRIDGDVTWRRQVSIPAVTLTPSPAYSGAKVMAMREGDDAFDAPALTETLAWLDTL